MVSGISTSLHPRNAIAAAYFVAFLALLGPAACATRAKSAKSSKAGIVAPLPDGFFDYTKLSYLCYTYLERIFFSVTTTIV